MKTTRSLLIVSLILVIILGLFWVYYSMMTEPEIKEIRNVSVIIYGNSSEQWENLSQGAERAAKDLGAEVSIVTMSGDNDAGEQIGLINREINNGASAIMIAVCNSEELRPYLNHLESKIPIIMVETGIMENAKYKCISSDNFEMGSLLARHILENEDPKVKVAIIYDNEQRDSVVERYEGFCETFAEHEDRIVLWKRNENEKSIDSMLYLQRELTEEAVDIVVALDNTATEGIVDAVLNLNKSVKIYGIGNTDKAVSNLDSDTITELVYQNEFSIGYLGMQEVLGAVNMSEEELQSLIEFRAVTKEDMYTAENQKMLFPFVK